MKLPPTWTHIEGPWGFWNGEPGMDRLVYMEIAAVVSRLRRKRETICYEPQSERKSRPEPDIIFAGVEVG